MTSSSGGEKRERDHFDSTVSMDMSVSYKVTGNKNSCF